jgi:hypothetical protein
MICVIIVIYYDFMKLQTRIGKIETINITPVRGIFKNPNDNLPARKINLDYQHEFHDLFVVTHQAAAIHTRHRLLLSSQE